MLLLAGTTHLVLAAPHRRGLFQHPEGPSQQCADDAGPPWADDERLPYFVNQPNRPVLPPSGECSSPLKAACAAKGALAAHLDGPVDCGGRGWFCRITEEPDHRQPGIPPGKFPDSNFASCDPDRTIEPWEDEDGHCHGSDTDNVYGWWVRDHWHRNYAGRLHCCCDLAATKTVVNRCDFRKYVAPEDVAGCRDANEEHTVDISPGCERGVPAVEPPADQCWTVEHFGPGDEDNPPPKPSTSTTPKSSTSTTPKSSTSTTPKPSTSTPPKPSTSTPPTPEPPLPDDYMMSEDGRCPPDTMPIFDAAECAEAAEQLDLFDVMPSTTTRRRRPAGCYWRGSNTRDALWFAPRGSHTLEATDRTAICAARPPPEYARMLTGACAEGFRPVETPLECEYAAHRLDRSDVTARQIERDGDRPFGCYEFDGRLYYNTAGDAKSEDTRRVALCVRDDE